jgi:protein-S-isoprenylcysteine O-methyltransferase Ste14
MVATAHSDAVRTRPSAGAFVSTGYAAACYLAFVGVLVWAVAFLADVRVSRTVDHGGPHTSTWTAVVVDAALLAVFAVQHSVMARPAFKRRWLSVVPRHVERSTYVLAASATLALAFSQWHPVTTVVWHVSAPWAQVVVWSLYAAGWAWVLAMTFAIDHLDLFGLRQVTVHLRGLAETAPSFVLPLPYRVVRHPMMLGFLVAFVATPTMTVGHLLFAALGGAYILFGVRLEERDLAEELPEYADYAATTPRLVPRMRPRRG